MGNEASLQHTNIVRGAGGPQAVSAAPKSVTVTHVEAKIPATEDKENAVEAEPVEDQTNYVRFEPMRCVSAIAHPAFLDVARQTGRSAAPHARLTYDQGTLLAILPLSPACWCGFTAVMLIPQQHFWHSYNSQQRLWERNQHEGNIYIRNEQL